MLFTTTPANLMAGCISKTPSYHKESTLVSPLANTVYREGRKAFLDGVARSNNPYREIFMTEIDITWTSEDCWELGWDLEEELNEQE